MTKLFRTTALTAAMAIGLLSFMPLTHAQDNGDTIEMSSGDMMSSEPMSLEEECANPDPEKVWPWGLNPCEKPVDEDGNEIVEEYTFPKGAKPRTDIKVKPMQP
jgi:hypothetical protein